MFLSTQLRNETLFSARTSQRSQKQQNQNSMRNHSYRKVDNVKQEIPKMEFRKVIIQRGKNSRVREDNEIRTKGMNKQSRISFSTCREEKEISVREKQVLSIQEDGKSVAHEQPNHLIKQSTKNTQESRIKKFSFIQKLGNAKLLKQAPIQQPTMALDNSQKLSLSSSIIKKQRTSSALSQKFKQSKFKFIKDDRNYGLKEQNTEKIEDMKNSRLLIREDNKQARPLSSASNKSSFSRLTNRQHRQDIELITNEKNKNTETQKSFSTALTQNKKKEKQQKVYTWHELLEEFDSSEKKINQLIEEKWKLIQKKLTDQKHQYQEKINTNKTKMRNTETQSLSRLSKQSQIQSPAKQPYQQKYSFSFQIAQKQIDLQVMNEIKKLRSLDLSKVIYSQEEMLNFEEYQAIKQRLQQRRSQIVEKALAQSMVEAELLKKYYSGQNYNGLATSNYKVGQQTTKQKLILKLKTTKSPLIKDIKLSQQRISEPQSSITKESQNQIKYNKHNEQDYQKFRYRHAIFKPNLQPLPQSSYRSQFFSYGNIRAYGDPYKEQVNMIFPTTGGVRNSSYRSEYNQHNSQQRINFRQLDAYRDKYKQVNMMYIPKKRSQSEAKTLRKHKQNPKFMNQLQYVKRLKTQSLIDQSRRKEIASKITKQMFLSESRKEFQNPQNLPQHYMKSEIKHKNLMAMKYDFKRKVHA